MDVTKFGQVFYPHEANALFGRCRCSDDSGSCDWCLVYYHGVEKEYSAEEIAADNAKYE